MKRPQNFPGSVFVPQQPGVKFKSGNYQERIQYWNPLAKNGLGLFYQMETGPEGRLIDIIPDNCFDFVFYSGPENGAHIHGPLRYHTTTALLPSSTYFCFKPFSLTSCKKLKVPFCELLDKLAPFETQFDDLSIIERMAAASSFEERIGLIMDYASEYMVCQDYRPGLVEHLEIAFCKSKGTLKVEEITADIGYTDRYCRAKFKEVHGISTKNYSDIMRFQNIVRMFTLPGRKVSADIVYENHLYDQSHLIREFKKYTHLTPREFKLNMFSQ